jgi:hypothetical protein
MFGGPMDGETGCMMHLPRELSVPQCTYDGTKYAIYRLVCNTGDVAKYQYDRQEKWDVA